MGINSFSSKTAPDMVLQQAIFGKVPDIPPYAALAELNNRTKSKQMQQAQMGQQAMAQNAQQQQQPPIAQQVAQQAQAMDQGVGALPTQGQHFAAGGIVSFSGGGGSDEGEEQTPYGESVMKALKAMGMAPMEAFKWLVSAPKDTPPVSNSPVQLSGENVAYSVPNLKGTYEPEPQYQGQQILPSIGANRSAGISVRGGGGLGGLGIKRPVNGANSVALGRYTELSGESLANEKAKGKAMYAEENAAYDVAIDPAQKYYTEMFEKAKAASEHKKDWIDRLAEVGLHAENKGRGRLGASLASGTLGARKAEQAQEALRMAQMEKAMQQRTAMQQARLQFQMGNTQAGAAAQAGIRTANERNIGIGNQEQLQNANLASEKYKTDASMYGHEVSAAASLQSAQMHLAQAQTQARTQQEERNILMGQEMLRKISIDAENAAKTRMGASYDQMLSLSPNTPQFQEKSRQANQIRNDYIRDQYKLIAPQIRQHFPEVDAIIRGTSKDRASDVGSQWGKASLVSK